MKEIKFKHKKEQLYMSMGISEERSEALAEAVKTAILRGEFDDDVETISEMVEIAFEEAEAETAAELLFLGMMLGRKLGQLEDIKKDFERLKKATDVKRSSSKEAALEAIEELKELIKKHG